MESKLPKISIIVPVYGVVDYLDRCIESIIVQAYDNLEIILVDDGSTDGSSDLCDKWAQIDSRIITHHKENAGVSEARNDGISMSSGEYILFIDPDDYVDDDYLSNINKYCNAYDLVGFSYKMVYDTEDEAKNVVEYTNFHSASSHEESMRLNFRNLIGLSVSDLKRWNRGGNLTEHRATGMATQFLFKAEIIKGKNIKFRSDIIYKEDEMFVAEYLIYTNSVHMLDEHYYNYVQYSTSISKSIAGEKKLNNKFSVVKAKNELRLLALDIDNSDTLDYFSVSNVLSVLEVGTLCIKSGQGYRKFKEFIKVDNVQESIKRVPLELNNPKFNVALGLMKLKIYWVIYIVLYLTMLLNIKVTPKNI